MDSNKERELWDAEFAAGRKAAQARAQCPKTGKPAWIEGYNSYLYEMRSSKSSTAKFVHILTVSFIDMPDYEEGRRQHQVAAFTDRVAAEDLLKQLQGYRFPLSEKYREEAIQELVAQFDLPCDCLPAYGFMDCLTWHLFPLEILD